MQENIQNFIGLTNQLILHLNRIPVVAYSERLSVFGGSTIGEHVRHIHNFPECLLRGVQEGTVNYDKRKRDTKIEIDRTYAIDSLLNISKYILNLGYYEDIPLLLEVGTFEKNNSKMTTNLKRELHYITEHTIHHMAILRLGMTFHFPEIKIEDSFGFAYSTLEYQKNNPTLGIKM